MRAVVMAVMLLTAFANERVHSFVCKLRGELPVRVLGVSGFFCVPLIPCDGLVSMVDSPRACPLAGQQEVLGQAPLTKDSCCAVVDNTRGTLGCILVSDDSQAKCLTTDRNTRDITLTERRKTRSRVLKDAVSSNNRLYMTEARSSPAPVALIQTPSPIVMNATVPATTPPIDTTSVMEIPVVVNNTVAVPGTYSEATRIVETSRPLIATTTTSLLESPGSSSVGNEMTSDSMPLLGGSNLYAAPESPSATNASPLLNATSEPSLLNSTEDDTTSHPSYNEVNSTEYESPGTITPNSLADSNSAGSSLIEDGSLDSFNSSSSPSLTAIPTFNSSSAIRNSTVISESSFDSGSISSANETVVLPPNVTIVTPSNSTGSTIDGSVAEAGTIGDDESSLGGSSLAFAGSATSSAGFSTISTGSLPSDSGASISVELNDSVHTTNHNSTKNNTSYKSGSESFVSSSRSSTLSLTGSLNGNFNPQPTGTPGILQLAPISDDSGSSPNNLDGGINSPSANRNQSGGSNFFTSNAVTFAVVGSLVAVALVVGVFYLRPKRANALDYTTRRASSQGVVRTGALSYEPSFERDPSSPYDASTTPRVMSALI